MRALFWTGIVVAASLPLGTPVGARETLDASGYLRFDKRFVVEMSKGKLVHDGVPQFPIYHQGYLQLLATPTEDVEVKASGVLRYYDFMVARDLYGLQRTEEGFPLEPLLWEAYADLYALGTDRLDVRIGKQRIAWGTADRFNPTDNLNPLDLSDFLAFGERVPTWAIKADLFVVEGWLRLTGVLLAGPTAVSLPRYASLPLEMGFDSSMELPEGVEVGELTIELERPAYDAAHTMQALKAAGNLAGVDWSVSYFHGFMDLPVPTLVEVEVASLTPSVLLDVDVTTRLPEVSVWGFDFAGELFSVGWWAEGAVFFPEKVETRYTVVADLYTMEPTVALDDEPYFKYTLGLDYTLPWQVYCNFQLIRGFFTERGEDELDHYLLWTLRKKLLDDTLTLQATVMWETDDFERVKGNYGVAVIPELGWKPYDNVDLAVGYLGVFSHVRAGNAMTLALYEDDQAYLKAKVSF